MPHFYTLSRNPDCAGRKIKTRKALNYPQIPWSQWRKGKPLPENVQTPNPIQFDLYPMANSRWDTDPFIPAMFETSVPLWREDLREAATEFGVTNIEYFPTEIIDPDDDSRIRNYYALNVIGISTAEDYAELKTTGQVSENDEHPLHFFRLEDSPIALVVSEEFKDHLIRKGFGKDLSFSVCKRYALHG